METKQLKPKRKQITVSPETKKKLDTAYGDYVKEWGYISFGEFSDKVIGFSLAITRAEEEEGEGDEMDGGDVDDVYIPHRVPVSYGFLPPVSQWKSMGTFADAMKGESDE